MGEGTAFAWHPLSSRKKKTTTQTKWRRQNFLGDCPGNMLITKLLETVWFIHIYKRQRKAAIDTFSVKLTKKKRCYIYTRHMLGILRSNMLSSFHKRTSETEISFASIAVETIIILSTLWKTLWVDTIFFPGNSVSNLLPSRSLGCHATRILTEASFGECCVTSRRMDANKTT